MSKFDPEWTLYYWSPPAPKTMKGRGEYIRLMFEAAECPFNEVNDPTKILEITDLNGQGSATFPCFAPPVVTGPNGLCLSQTTAILAQLGQVLGFYPEPADEFKALQICMSIADYHAEGFSMQKNCVVLVCWR